MLKNFTWNMTGYIPKYPVDPSADGIRPYIAERIFQVEPEPPKVDNSNEYILSALSEQNLLYFSFFLHYYEPQLNKRIKSFLGVENGEGYNTDRFLDIKLDCREIMLQKLTDYDPSKGCRICHLHLSIHPGCDTPFPYERRKMVGIFSDKL